MLFEDVVDLEIFVAMGHVVAVATVQGMVVLC